MASVRKDFDSYLLYYYSTLPYPALIQCYQGSTFVGGIVFYPDGSSLPPNRNTASGPEIHYPISRFDDVMSILRYEKPLALALNTDNLIGYVTTSSREPVGEEE